MADDRCSGIPPVDSLVEETIPQKGASSSDHLTRLTSAALSTATSNSSSRVFAGNTVATGLALSLQAGALTLGLLGVVPLLSLLSQAWGPALMRRMDVRDLVVRASIAERIGVVIAAGSVFALTGRWQITGLILGLAIMSIAIGIVEVSLTAIMAEALPPGQQGAYQGRRSRWLSLAGMAVGLVVGVMVDTLEQRFGLPPIQVRAGALVVAVACGIHAIYRLRQMLAMLPLWPISPSALIREIEWTPLWRMHTWLPGGWNWLRGLNLYDRRVAALAAFYGLGYGITIRHGDAAALGPLGFTLGQLLWMSSIIALSGVIVSVRWGQLADHVGASSLMALAGLWFIAITPCLYIAALLVDRRWLFGSFVTYGVGLTCFNTMLPIWLIGMGRRRQPHRSHGRSHSPSTTRYVMFQAVFGITASIGPLIGGTIRHLAELKTSVSVGFIALFLCAWVIRSAAVWMGWRLIQIHHPRHVRRLRRWWKQGTRAWSVRWLPRWPLPLGADLPRD